MLQKGSLGSLVLMSLLLSRKTTQVIATNMNGNHVEIVPYSIWEKWDRCWGHWRLDLPEAAMLVTSVEPKGSDRPSPHSHPYQTSLHLKWLDFHSLYGFIQELFLLILRWLLCRRLKNKTKHPLQSHKHFNKSVISAVPATPPSPRCSHRIILSSTSQTLYLFWKIPEHRATPSY